MARVLIPRTDTISAKKVSPTDWEKYFDSSWFIDYVISGLTIAIGAGLSVDVAVGKCRLLGHFLELDTASENVGSLTASTTNFIYATITRAASTNAESWAFTKNTTGVTPVDSILIASCITGVSTVTSVDNTVAQKEPSMYATQLFGDGSDGNTTISSDTTITTTKYYDNLTINSTFNLIGTSPQFIFVKGLLTLTGNIHVNGKGGAGATGGAGGVGGAGGRASAPQTGGAGVSGTAGGTGGAATNLAIAGIAGGASVPGTAGTPGSSPSGAGGTGTGAGSGGGGGSGSGGVGGAGIGASATEGAGGAAAPATHVDIHSLLMYLSSRPNLLGAGGGGAGGAGGGGGGGGGGPTPSLAGGGGAGGTGGIAPGGAGGNGGDGTNPGPSAGGGGGGGAGGGAGGAGGGTVIVLAKNITGTGKIQSNGFIGGAGGGASGGIGAAGGPSPGLTAQNGGGGGGGARTGSGGAGGNGGFIMVITKAAVFPTIEVLGGAGGAAGGGTSAPGGAGGSGPSPVSPGFGGPGGASGSSAGTVGSSGGVGLIVKLRV